MCIKRFAIALCLVAVVVSAWQTTGDMLGSVRLYISTPLLVITYFFKNYRDLFLASSVTLFESVCGLCCAVALTCICGAVAMRWVHVERLMTSVMVVTQMVPLIVFAPFLVLVLGFGYSSKIVMSALISFFPGYSNLMLGVRRIPENILQRISMTKLSHWQKISTLLFPLAMPQLVSGVKVGSDLALIGALVAEMSGARWGLGKNIFIASLRLQPELLISSILLTIALGGLLRACLVLIERRFRRWNY